METPGDPRDPNSQLIWLKEFGYSTADLANLTDLRKRRVRKSLGGVALPDIETQERVECLHIAALSLRMHSGLHPDDIIRFTKQPSSMLMRRSLFEAIKIMPEQRFAIADGFAKSLEDYPPRARVIAHHFGHAIAQESAENVLWQWGPKPPPFDNPNP